MNVFPEGLWRPASEDRRALLVISLLPVLAALPQLLGFVLADPLLYLGAITLDLIPGPMKGSPYIDPNSGYSTQALGRLAAWQWLQGTVPWWNHYTGIGLPLAAEYQGGAFFPLTFLLLLPKGMVWHQVALQILAAIGTYGLLRQLGLTRFASTAGALLYAFNGTLAWFAHAPATPVPFLPWMLWGIERIAAFARIGVPGGWRMLTFAMAMSLLASFPETAYLSGLLALAWTIMRGLQLPNSAKGAFARAIVLGGVTGIAIAAPQVYSFLDYLRYADIGEHGGRFAHEAMNPMSLLQSLVAPYFFGPIFAYADGKREWLFLVWGAIGGYVTLALIAAAAVGFLSRRDALAWLLLGWCLATLLRTFGVPGMSHAWNLIPGVSLAAFYRYACPSWELAIVILAARGLDACARGELDRRASFRAVATVLAAGLAAVVWQLAAQVWPLIRDSAALRNWAAGSVLLSVLLTVNVMAQANRGVRGVRILGAALVAEAMLMFLIPTLANPRGGRIDAAAIQFLRDHLGFQRFYTLGPLQPNYGAYFRLPSINYNVLPNSTKWYRWTQDMLDQKADPVVFNGLRGSPDSHAEMLRRHRRNYEEAAVRFVLTYRGQNPFAPDDPVRRVYQDAILDIYELPEAKQYFDSAGGNCTFEAAERGRVTATCRAPDRLFRRELFFPGWSAKIDGRDATLIEHLDLYHAVEVPAGRSVVTFAYSPRHVEWAWLAMALGLVAVVGAPLGHRLRRARPWEPRNRSAS